ncbi:unnamed protein product [Citrullus colocynthis]|uniref:Calmodulin binding protein-like N-terminal domain-containing protein n=1 Tax=Citrullus colocynthis TaxID=252529 RepID=A0ABP0Z550_9ROSI
MVQPFEPVQQDDEQQQNQPNRICHCLTSGLGVGAEVLRDESLAYFEKQFRLLVREEVKTQLQAHFNLSHQSYSSSSRSMKEVGVMGMVNLRLRFMNNIPSIMFTKDKIKAENREAVEVGLFDVTNNSIVETQHPLSSMLIEVVVLNGEFNVDEEAITQSDFDKNIVPQRMGKPPFHVGHTRFRLKNGILFINNLSFTTNSSRSKTKNIRLGLRVMEDQIMPNNNYPTIRRAVSNPFKVKNRPLQQNKLTKDMKPNDELGPTYELKQPIIFVCKKQQSLGENGGMENEGVFNQNTAASNGHELADQTFLGDFKSSIISYLKVWNFLCSN